MRNDCTPSVPRSRGGSSNHVIISSSHVLPDNKVKNLWGEDLGRVEELVLDAADGRIRYALVSFGGFLGSTDRWFAVPWNLLAIDRPTRTIHLLADRAALRFAPKFNRKDRKKLFHSDYLNDVDAHFLPRASADEQQLTSAAV